MNDSPLMSIGTFARASLLTVSALRSYHQRGLLVPAAVDASTGYRTYHAGQLNDAAVLRRLRALDLPLNAVAEVLEARDSEVTRKILAEHETEMRKQLERTAAVVADLQRAVTFPRRETPVRLENVDHHYGLARSVEVSRDDLPAFLADVYPELLAVAQRFGGAVIGEAAALYPNVLDDDSTQPVTAYFPIEEAISVTHTGAEVIELPAQELAVITHVGGYETLADSYASLGAWLAHNAEPSDDPIREIYRTTMKHSDDPEDYLTDICWPTRQTGGTGRELSG